MTKNKHILISSRKSNDVFDKIHEIRGTKVIMDADHAEMYDTETKRLKEAVRRNISRFPADFMFQLNEREFKSLRSQFASSEKGGTRYSSICIY